MQFLWLYIDDLVGKGLNFGVILEFLGWGSATILPLALPLATLLASIMTLGNMGENNELLAMKAAGISLNKILNPLIYVAVGICIGAFFISNNLIPISYKKIYTLQYDIGRTKSEIKIPTDTFYNGIDGYTLRINDRNKKTDMMYNVLIYNHSSNKGNIQVAIADSGLIKSTKDKSALFFTLFDGVQYQEDNQRHYRDTTYKLQKISFTKQNIVIPLENYAFEKSEDDEKYSNEIMSKNLKVLRHDRDSLSIKYNQVFNGQIQRFYNNCEFTHAKELNPEVDKFSGYRLNNVDSSMVWENPEAELAELRLTIKSLNQPINTLKSYDREIRHYDSTLRRIDLESYRKFTLSFACLIFFFIGAPLGAILRKGGFGTPMIVSALFFILYWVVDISGKKLARDGSISPWLGAFISTFVLLPIGIFLTRKATKDSSLFNFDKIKEKWNKSLKFFKKYKHKHEAIS